MFAKTPEISGGEVDFSSGAIQIGVGTYYAEDFRLIPIKMSLNGYRFNLMRISQSDQKSKIAAVLEYRECDRDAPMSVQFADDHSRDMLLWDIKGAEFDLNHEAGGDPAFVDMTPELLCTSIAAHFDAAQQLRKQVDTGVLMYRTNDMQAGDWKRFKLNGGFLPYMPETAKYVRDQFLDDEVVIANDFFVESDCDELVPSCAAG